MAPLFDLDQTGGRFEMQIFLLADLTVDRPGFGDALAFLNNDLLAEQVPTALPDSFLLFIYNSMVVHAAISSQHLGRQDRSINHVSYRLRAIGGVLAP